jgi:hypothetical protein
MVHQIKTYDGKILVELKLNDHGTEFYTSNELSVLKQKIMDANREHGLQFENDFSSLNGIKDEKINDKFTEISERWGLNYETKRITN